MRKLDQLVIVDVEATCWKDDSLPKSQLPRRDESEIIEVGVCLLDLQSFEVSDARSILVKPVKNPILSDFCTQLTGITQAQVDAGISFADACKILRKDYDAKNRSWSSYGKYDDNIFTRECTRKNVGYPFGKFHINIKAVVETVLGQTAGMAEALQAFNMMLEGKHHSGVDDAQNIARIYAMLLGKMRRPWTNANSNEMGG